MRTELKRCTITEMRWNRNEVSRGSPDKELNWRPTSLMKFTQRMRSVGQGSEMQPIGRCNQERSRVLTLLITYYYYYF